MSQRQTAARSAPTPGSTPGSTQSETRRRRGAQANRWGAEAERLAANAYRRRGAVVLDMRRRNEGGETDLIVRIGQAMVFVEVKARRRMEDALRAAPPRSWRRRGAAAVAYAAEIGHCGDIRLDLAAVDQTGHVQIVENAGMAATF